MDLKKLPPINGSPESVVMAVTTGTTTTMAMPSHHLAGCNNINNNNRNSNNNSNSNINNNKHNNNITNSNNKGSGSALAGSGAMTSNATSTFGPPSGSTLDDKSNAMFEARF